MDDEADLSVHDEEYLYSCSDKEKGTVSWSKKMSHINRWTFFKAMRGRLVRMFGEADRCIGSAKSYNAFNIST
jgi:hypothetical protein